MKKSFVSILIGLMIFGIGGSSWAGVTATDVICTGCVNDTDIATGAVTNVKIADGTVTSTKVSDGAITDAKIGGPISASKIEKPANVVVVAKAGGDYTSISAALAAINPTADNPYLIKVMPGVYNESVTMKSYVHLQGAGRDVTRIVWLDAPDYEISCDNVTNVAISGFSIEGGTGISISGSSPTITGNRISSYYYGHGIDNGEASPTIKDNIIEQCRSAGISNVGNSKPLITNNKIINNGYGIANDGWAVPTITNNIITGAYYGIFFHGGGGMTSNEKSIIEGNIIEANQIGISHIGVSSLITNNKIRGNVLDGINNFSYGWGNRPDGTLCCISAPIIDDNIISDNGRWGISDGNPTIIHNKITGNASTDIYISPWPETSINIGFNVYDTLSGSGAVGNYNLKSDGSSAPLQ